MIGAVRLRMSRRRALQVTACAVLTGGAAALVATVPRLTGSTWAAVRGQLAGIGAGTAFALAGLWLAGLVVYTVAMTSSMPGLSHKRALALNLAGSGAANLLPFGGVVGTGVNVAMIRSWRLSLRHFASSAAVLNVVNLVTKLTLPVIAGIVVSRQKDVAPWLGRSAWAASALGVAVVAVMVWALVSHAWAARVDGFVRRLSRGRITDGGHVAGLQRQVRDVFRLRWRGLTTGMTGYVLLQWAMFALCLHAAGVGAGVGAVFAAFAVERAVTLAVVTPAGTGIAEAASAGLLVALGFNPAASAAGVLLYRLFVYLAEIPVGVLVLGAWASIRVTRRGRSAVSASPTAITASPPTASSR